MAAALLGIVAGEVAAGPRHESVTAVSAGLLESGRPVAPEVVSALRPFGADVTGHRSTRLTRAAVEGADLVLGMERRHGREAVLLVPAAWPRTYTLKDVVRRGEKSGPRLPGRSVTDWLATVGERRERTDLVGRSADDDVADPLGGDLAAYRATAAEIADLVQRMARLLWPDAMGVPIPG
jgi:protein-tyrosine phosphatase